MPLLAGSKSGCLDDSGRGLHSDCDVLWSDRGIVVHTTTAFEKPIRQRKGSATRHFRNRFIHWHREDREVVKERIVALVSERQRTYVNVLYAMYPMVPWAIAASEPKPAAEVSAWDVVVDNELDLEDRATALRQLVRENDLDVLLLASEILSKDDENRTWQNELAMASEWLTPCPNELAESLREALRTHAIRLQNANDPHGVAARRAAIRRFSSLLVPSDVIQLLQFLEGGQPLDTRDLVLQRVHLLLTEAPNVSSAIEPLRIRVFEIALKFLDPDVMTSNENMAVALNGMLATAATAHPKLVELAESARIADRRPFLRLVARQLSVQAATWSARTDRLSTEQHGAVQRVAEAIDVLTKA